MQQLMFQGDQQFGFDPLRDIGLAVYGGSDIGEVVEAASRVTSSELRRWHDAWLLEVSRSGRRARVGPHQRGDGSALVARHATLAG
ncbi:hypothetical protein GCM10009560_10280 [Nonomuraea longicatena]|uniref:Uncharacterized protein n=1 Tax=Nonomuraea longicatena TaxID=83682 RepID=A0ABN1NTF1_9ACTN